jgi:hypothetical protein
MESGVFGVAVFLRFREFPQDRFVACLGDKTDDNGVLKF